MPNYGDVDSSYGDSLYGDSTVSTKGVRNRVGTDFDIAINGVGLKLVPSKEAYHKKVAQTFSYNPRSLFKQGDGAALVAKDLYYWSRLEHSRWDGGETYDPWKPGDTSDPSRRDTKFSSSLGFDTSDQYKLSHLRDMYVSPSYEFTITNDTPLAYWILGDHPASLEAFDQIGPDRTPGTYNGGVTEGIAPGPIVNDPNTVDLFDGSSGYVATAGKVPFAGNQTAGAWSLEAWAAPSLLPQQGIIAAVGHEIAVGVGNYQAIVAADNPIGWWHCDDASTQLTDAMHPANNLGGSDGHADLSYHQPSAVQGGTFSVADKYDPGFLSFWGAGVDGHNTINVVSDGPVTGPAGYGFSDNFSAEAWIYPTSFTTYGTENGFMHGGIILLNGSEADQLTVLNWGMALANEGLAAGGALHHLWYLPKWSNNDPLYHAYDTGYQFPAINQWYHVVMVRRSGTMHFYVNGVEVGVPTTLAPFKDEREGFSIGGRPAADPLSDFDGRIDEVAIYNYPLTADQVLTHYLQGAGSVGGFGFGIASADGSTTGDELVIRLPGVGWFDGGYAFANEVPDGITWWRFWWDHVHRDKFINPYELVPAPNVWHHIVAASDGSAIKVYVDGVLKTTINQTQLNTPSWASVGAMRTMDATNIDHTPEWFFNGQICQTAVWGVQLSAAQVLAHYNAGIGASSQTLLTSGQDVAKFIETFDGYLYINQKSTKINFSNDGGISWQSVSLPGGDVSTITAIWSRGDKVYVATGQHVYLGDHTGFAVIETGGNPAIINATCGLYYSGQLYIGLGTSLYYVDPATGAQTQLYDTKSFGLKFIEAFQGKIWFGGSAGRQTKVWTWTNNTLPPTPANGVGAQLQDGTIPFGFIVQSSTVYLNVLLLGGLICGDSTSEGQGAVYYIEPAGSFGQLCVLGPPMSKVRGTGVDYGVRSLWGAEDRLWMGYNNLTGVGVYNFVTGSFVTNSRTTKYVTATVNAVCRVRGRNLFTIKDDGNCWREGDSKVGTAVLEESEFQELPFIPKIIDGIEGMHSPLRTGEQIEVQISYDFGLSWQSLGINSEVGDNEIDFKLINTLANHWRTRIISYRGGDVTTSPEIYSHSERFAPRNTPNHEWVAEALLPVKQKTVTGAILTDPGNKLLASLWTAYEDGVAIEYIDRDKKAYRCLILFMDEVRDKFTPARSEAGQLNLSPAVHIELLEVEQVS